MGEIDEGSVGRSLWAMRAWVVVVALCGPCRGSPGPWDIEATSVLESSCTKTCLALNWEDARLQVACRASCKRQKPKAQRQAALRKQLDIGAGVRLDARTRTARINNATVACLRNGTLAIERWSGRLGNEVTQLANCLTFSHAFGCRCAAPQNGVIWRFLDAEKLPRVLRGATGSDMTDFFWDVVLSAETLVDATAVMPHLPHDTGEQGSEKVVDAVIHELRGAVLIDRRLAEAAAAPYDVHIHVRSGDIFMVHDQTHYVPPPLSYYVDLIERHDFRRIRIVAEDDQNPVINALTTRYANATFEMTSLETDIAHIVGARRVIYGQGTFVPALLIFNERLEEYFRISYTAVEPYLEHDSPAVATVVDLTHYFKLMFPWAASKHQRALQLSWPRCTTKHVMVCEPRVLGHQRRCKGGNNESCWKP